MVGMRRRVAVERVLMRVPRVAIGTAEGAADVRIDRPEAHPGRLRIVQHRARDRAEVADVLLVTDDRQRTSENVHAEQRPLLGSSVHLAHSVATPGCAGYRRKTEAAR